MLIWDMNINMWSSHSVPSCLTYAPYQIKCSCFMMTARPTPPCGTQLMMCSYGPRVPGPMSGTLFLPWCNSILGEHFWMVSNFMLEMTWPCSTTLEVYAMILLLGTCHKLHMESFPPQSSWIAWGLLSPVVQVSATLWLQPVSPGALSSSRLTKSCKPSCHSVNRSDTSSKGEMYSLQNLRTQGNLLQFMLPP